MRRELGMFVALLLMCGALWVSNPSFVEQANRFYTSRQIAMLTIYAVGIAFVIITGGIDLSVGSVIGLTGVIVAKLSAPPPGMRLPLVLGIGVALGVALLVGLIQGLLITRLDLQPFIVTLGFMLLLRGVSQTIALGGNITITDQQVVTLSGGGTQTTHFPALTHYMDLVKGGLFYVHGTPLLSWPVLICLVVIGIGGYILHYTVFGRYVYAIGGNRDAAEYSGIPVKRVETLTYVISAGMAGLAGILYAAFIKNMDAQHGQSYELIAIAAAVLGGCSLRGGEGTVIGVLIGCMIMQIIDNGFNYFRIGNWVPNENWKAIVNGAVILVAVILDRTVHIVQSKRRTRRAGLAAASPQPTVEVVSPGAA
ncbi:MAG: Sugar transport system permease [Phycisphaerales bacterium]|nr:Sugar transport system permease [Phycisphaerales bacterium]